MFRKIFFVLVLFEVLASFVLSLSCAPGEPRCDTQSEICIKAKQECESDPKFKFRPYANCICCGICQEQREWGESCQEDYYTGYVYSHTCRDPLFCFRGRCIRQDHLENLTTIYSA